MSEYLDLALDEWSKGGVYNASTGTTTRLDREQELIEGGYLEVVMTAKGWLGSANNIRCETPDPGERNCTEQRMDEMGWCNNCIHRHWLMQQARQA